MQLSLQEAAGAGAEQARKGELEGKVLWGCEGMCLLLFCWVGGGGGGVLLYSLLSVSL